MTTRVVFSAIVALGLLGAAGAMAQTTSPSTAPSTAAAPATTGSDTNKAVNTSSAPNPGAPVAGANSFTEGQAQARIGDQGYTQVSALTLDNQGVWRGTAMKNGKSVEVALDYQGNVVAK